jgi:two-component system chemotaxis sensor kinase CheA
MTERELVNLIFAPGFSTVEKVSDLSGRGVGMDVVRSNTEKMGGTVEVETVLGKGTTILLRLPLTLAIIPSMIVGVAGHRFAIPQLHVVEFVSVRAADVPRRIEQVNESEVLRLRDRLLPLVHLASVLNIRSERGSGRGRKRTAKTPAPPTSAPADSLAIADAPLPPGTTADEPVDGTPAPGTIEGEAGVDYHIVVLKIGLNHFGVVVDELFDIEEVVVKPTSIYARANKCFSGATIVGDGGVIMILDVGGLATLAGLKFPDLEAESKRRLALEKQSAAVRPIILCTGAPNEYFAIPQESILRLEMFPRSSIQNVGGEEFVNYRGTGLPLLRMERYLAVSPVDPALKEIFVVIPKVVENGNVQRARAGIVISSIIDALDVDVKLEAIHVAGVAGEASVLGSAVLDGHLTLFLKIDEILKAASFPGLLPDQHFAHHLQPGRHDSAAMLSA